MWQILEGHCPIQFDKLTLRKIAIWMSKKCKKIALKKITKNIAKNCHFVQKIANGKFLE